MRVNYLLRHSTSYDNMKFMRPKLQPSRYALTGIKATFPHGTTCKQKECWGHNLQIFSGLQISKPKKFNFVSSVAFGYLTSAINQKNKRSVPN